MSAGLLVASGVCLVLSFMLQVAGRANPVPEYKSVEQANAYLASGVHERALGRLKVSRQLMTCCIIFFGLSVACMAVQP